MKNDLLSQEFKEIHKAKEFTLWHGLKLCKGCLFGKTLDDNWFAFDFRISSKILILTFISINGENWRKKWIKPSQPLYEVLLSAAKSGWLQCYGVITIQPLTTKAVSKCAVQKKVREFVKVDLPADFASECFISLVTKRWYGFLLQKGHIFGTYENKMLFVSSYQRRESDDAIAVHLTYDQSSWLKDWIEPSNDLMLILQYAKKYRDSLGIAKLEFGEGNNAEHLSLVGNGLYAKQDFQKGSPFYTVSSGGLVRPK